MNQENAQTQPNKIKVGVIFGGRSGEHEVSLQSGQSVMAALNRNKYEVVPIGITKDGRWLTGNVVAALTAGETASYAALLPDPMASSLMMFAEDDTIEGLTAVTQLDVLIPVLHGTYGEDGTVQGLLELAGLPYVGAGVVGSAVGMDKAIFKHVMLANGIPILPWQLVIKRDWLEGKRPLSTKSKPPSATPSSPNPPTSAPASASVNAATAPNS